MNVLMLLRIQDLEVFADQQHSIATCTSDKLVRHRGVYHIACMPQNPKQMASNAPAVHFNPAPAKVNATC